MRVPIPLSHWSGEPRGFRGLKLSRTLKVLRVVALLGLLLVMGCVLPNKVIRFNNNLARSNFKLAESAREFRKVVDPLMKSGVPVSSSAVRTAQGKMETALRSARDRFDTGYPPAQSTQGVKVLEQYKDFLQVQQSILDNNVTKIVRTIEEEESKPGRGQAPDWASARTVVRTQVKTIVDAESKATEKLNEVLKSFYDEHNLQATATGK